MLGSWIGSIGAESVSIEFVQTDSVPWFADVGVYATVVIGGAESWSGVGGLGCRYGSVLAELSSGEKLATLDVDRDAFSGLVATAASGVFRTAGVEAPVLLNRPD
jgi:hypothetical protein